jgi:hypothetical protein
MGCVVSPRGFLVYLYATPYLFSTYIHGTFTPFTRANGYFFSKYYGGGKVSNFLGCISRSKGLFVWAVAGWLCRENCCAEKAAVQGKLLF